MVVRARAVVAPPFHFSFFILEMTLHSTTRVQVYDFRRIVLCDAVKNTDKNCNRRAASLTAHCRLQTINNFFIDGQLSHHNEQSHDK